MMWFVCLRQFVALVNDSPTLTKLANSSLYPLFYVVQQFIHWLFMAYSLVPFCLLTYDKWLRVSQGNPPRLCQKPPNYWVCL